MIDWRGVARVSPLALAAMIASCSRRPPAIWIVADTVRIAGHDTTVWGAPQSIDTQQGRALCFDGKQDGLLLDVNPLEGLAEFTVEVLFKPDPDGAPEQRFVHFAEDGGDDRALLETRVTPQGKWYLDTFLHKGEEKLALIDQQAQHPAGEWYWAALTYRDRQMRHFVNGREEAAGTLSFVPLGHGQTSLGVRQNKVSWFKGCIRELRIFSSALPPEKLERSRTP